MPVVVLPNVYVFPQQDGHKAAEVRVAARDWAGVFRELAQRLPAIADKLVDPESNPHDWFSLYRDSDGENLRFDPGYEIGDDERLLLIYAIAD